MKNPRVSVCIVTYNHQRYIRDCVMTVLMQEGDVPLEILVGDDASNDETSLIVHDLVSRFPETIQYFRHETRLGPAGNYQFLIQQAKGEYIAHLDGDDYWFPGKLKAQVARMDQELECPAIYSNALCINDDGGLLGIFNNHQPDRFEFSDLLRRGNFLNHSSILYRARFRDEILSWAPDFIDYRIHLYLASKGAIGYLNVCGVVYRVASNTSMIVHRGDYVRDLYWKAIKNAPVELVEPKIVLIGLSDFLRRVFFRSIRVRSWALFAKWWSIVAQEYPNSKKRLALLMVSNILLTALYEIKGYIVARFGGIRLRVIYWH